MSRVFKTLKEAIVKEGEFKKFFRKHTPGNRIFPPKAKNNDAKYQLRIDAGEVINGVKNVYLQVNSEAKNEALKKWRAKYKTDGNIAVAQINEDTPLEKQGEAVSDMLNDLEGQYKNNIG